MGIDKGIIEKAKNSDLNRQNESKESLKEKISDKLEEYEDRCKELDREDLLTDVEAIESELEKDNLSKALIMVHRLEDLS